MKVRLTKPADDENGEPYEIGYINDRPDSHWWLSLEIAEPVDDEAKALQKVLDARRNRLKTAIERQAEQARDAQLADMAEAEKQRQEEFAAQLMEGT
jgi:hypothetical protein